MLLYEFIILISKILDLDIQLGVFITEHLVAIYQNQEHDEQQIHDVYYHGDELHDMV
jgi:hypothetical protein